MTRSENKIFLNECELRKLVTPLIFTHGFGYQLINTFVKNMKKTINSSIVNSNKDKKESWSDFEYFVPKELSLKTLEEDEKRRIKNKEKFEKEELEEKKQKTRLEKKEEKKKELLRKIVKYAMDLRDATIEDDEVSLNDVNTLAKKYVLEEIIFLPGGTKSIDYYVTQTYEIFKETLLYNAVTINI